MSAPFRFAIVLFLIAALLLCAVPGETSAIPYTVEGYLKDSRGLPITLADITLSGQIYNSSLQSYETAVLHASTDANGYYRFVVGAMEPAGFDQGSKLTMAYTTDDGSVSRVVTVTGFGAWANLTYEENTGIQEILTSPVGLVLIVVIVVAVLITYYILKVPEEKGSADGEGKKTSKRVERRRRR